MSPTGFSAPRTFAVDEEEGLMLLEDLGDRTFTRALAAGDDEDELYRLAVDLLIELHRRFGSLPMSKVLEPAVGYARDGFPVSELIAYYWSGGRGLARFPGFAETFLPGGKAPAKGEIFRNPMLANTLETIGRDGRDAFYKGEIAEKIIQILRGVI